VDARTTEPEPRFPPRLVTMNPALFALLMVVVGVLLVAVIVGAVSRVKRSSQR
jgi:hypothetical protein